MWWHHHALGHGQSQNPEINPWLCFFSHLPNDQMLATQSFKCPHPLLSIPVVTTLSSYLTPCPPNLILHNEASLSPVLLPHSNTYGIATENQKDLYKVQVQSWYFSASNPLKVIHRVKYNTLRALHIGPVSSALPLALYLFLVHSAGTPPHSWNESISPPSAFCTLCLECSSWPPFPANSCSSFRCWLEHSQIRVVLLFTP